MTFPEGSTSEDKLAIKVNEVSAVTLYSVTTNEYSSETYETIDLEVDGFGFVEYPLDTYLVMIADGQNASFNLTYWYQNNTQSEATAD